MMTHDIEKQVFAGGVNRLSYHFAGLNLFFKLKITLSGLRG